MRHSRRGLRPDVRAAQRQARLDRALRLRHGSEPRGGGLRRWQHPSPRPRHRERRVCLEAARARAGCELPVPAVRGGPGQRVHGQHDPDLESAQQGGPTGAQRTHGLRAGPGAAQ